LQKNFKGLSTEEILKKTTAEKATIMIPHQPKKEVDLNILNSFLSQHVEQMDKDPYKSFFRKLYAYYDFLEYGFDI
jgi:hypothetical protein